MGTRLSHVILLAALATLACAAPARAQTATPTPANTQTQTSGASEAAVEGADLAITARVTARELRFEKVPNTSVEFTGRPRRDTVWEAGRHNLPPQVQPGVTYRDIGITLRIVSVFADIDRIVAEALGETPPSPEPAPQATPPPTTPPRPQASTPAARPAKSPRAASARKGGRR